MRPETRTAIRAVGIAREIADSRDGAGQITSKGGIDLVTATDIACEDAIRAELARDFPEHAIVGEERGGTVVASKPTWLIDPICGTRPFASDVPLYCSNAALLEDGALTVAAVAVGQSDEIAWAERDGGAWLRTATDQRAVQASALSDIVSIRRRQAHAGAI